MPRFTHWMRRLSSARFSAVSSASTSALMSALESALKSALIALVVGGLPAAWAGETGALLYSTAGQAARFDLASGRLSESALAASTTRLLGHANGLLAELEVDTSTRAHPNHYTARLRRVAGGALEAVGTLPAFDIEGGRISGPFQPAPDAQHFASQTQQSAGLGQPYVDHVLVFDRSARVVARLRGLRDPAWLGNDRLVAASDDGLYLLNLRDLRGGPSPAARIGRVGPAPERPSVSPDAGAIAFAQGGSIWRIGIDGSGLTRLTLPHAGQSWPAWSPDGTKLIVPRSDCPLIGAGRGAPELAVVSSTQPDQDIVQAPRIMRDGRVPLRACGPVYWTR